MSQTFFCSSCRRHHKPENLHSIKSLGKNNKRNICIGCADLMKERRSAQ